MDQNLRSSKRRPLRVLALTLGVMIFALVLALVLANKPRPSGTTGPEADALASHPSLTWHLFRLFRRPRFPDWIHL